MSKKQPYRLGILSTHPIQYYVPWYKALSKNVDIDLTVYYCHNQTAEDHAKTGYGVAFEWDIPMLEGYKYQFLDNKSRNPNVLAFFGCDTPDIKDILRKEQFDAFIVEGWSKKSFWQAITTCWKLNIPVMVRGDSNLYSHGGSLWKRIVKYPIYNWFIPKFDAFLYVGSRAKEYYLHYGASEEKMFFVPHSVDNDYFSNSKESLLPIKNKIRQKWGIPEDASVFILVGALIPRKRPYDFLSAIKKASEINPNVYGLIVGDGPLKKDLQNFAKEEKIPVHFTGFLNQGELPQAYTVGDCLINCSLIESWGLTVNEAMASGLPTIVADIIGSAPNLVFPDQTGLVFRCTDIDDLSSQILKLANDRSKMTKMGENAFNLIKEYSVEKSTLGTVEAIKSVYKNKS